MSTADVLAAGRRLAESLMESTVLVRRKTGETRDTATGKLVPTWATIYEGPARLRFGSTQPRDIDVGGQRSVEQQPTVGLPIASSADVRPDDEGTVTANPPDPGVFGTRFRIAGVHAQTHSTSRRFPVEVFTHV